MLPETTMCSIEFVYLLWTVGLFNGFAHSIQVVSNLGLTVGTGHGMLESRKNRERTSKQHGLALDGIKHTKSRPPPPHTLNCRLREFRLLKETHHPIRHHLASFVIVVVYLSIMNVLVAMETMFIYIQMLFVGIREGQTMRCFGQKLQMKSKWLMIADLGNGISHCSTNRSHELCHPCHWRIIEAIPLLLLFEV